MSPQLVRILLFLPFLFIGSTGNPELPKSRSFSVIQMPPFLNVSEGSDVRLNCKVEGNVSKWFVNWKKMEKKINNSSRIFVIKNEMKKSSILILKSTVVADSGIYCCEIGDLRDSQKGSTNVIIWEKPYVAVNQTPQNVSRRVGFNVSIACSFSRVANVSLMKVTWYKDKQELSNPNSEKLRQKVILRLLNVAVEDSGNYVCMIRIGNRTGSGNGTCVHITAANLLVIQSPPSIQTTEGENLTMDCRVQGKKTKYLHRVSWYKIASDGQKNLMTHGTSVLKDGSSLFLRNIKQEDSGNYTCEVDKYGQGNGTRVTILGREKPSQNANVDGDGRQPGPLPEKTESGIGIPVGTGVAVGTLIFLLLLGVLVWRSKRKRKGASENPLEVEPTVAEEAKKNTLTKQMNDVTYADIRFHKREAQLDTEVVYAEVRLGTKRPEHRDRGTQPTGLH
ncbi:vascular endothelial growth factor receptor 3-like isoform X2 [Ahaetulla prasina]|uniref:vascular endothelial growth factor receptor 3-like isoform X2 n=1 Tax=Ahaetulla prasina TaxID=499056 RepID=UPI0026473A3B|nr:vascular endothelial growth factor receptor 3-like isoform X2 [Ahaetulla prasina]